MKFDQTTFTDKDAGTHGDCTRAAIRTYVRDPLDGCPHPVAPGGGWNFDFWDWLDERGYCFAAAPYRADKDWSGILPRIVLAAGPTVRTAETGAHHMVVWDREEMRCVHDPHPSRAGLVKVNFFYWVVGREDYSALNAIVIRSANRKRKAPR